MHSASIKVEACYTGTTACTFSTVSVDVFLDCTAETVQWVGGGGYSNPISLSVSPSSNILVINLLPNLILSNQFCDGDIVYSLHNT